MHIGHWGYMLWLLLFVVIPTLILWGLNGKYLFHYRKVFLYCFVFSFLFGFVWDIWAIQTGMWYYPSAHILGPSFLRLPLEEYLFLLIGPVLFTSLALTARKYIRKEV
jgi:lycopene cyclase domain-containing protein